MSQLQIKEPFIMVVTDGIKTRFYKSEHQKNGRFKTISALKEEGSQTLEYSEIVKTIEDVGREQVVIVAPPKVHSNLIPLFKEDMLEGLVHMSRNMVRKTTNQILNYIQRKDKFQLVKQEDSLAS